MDDIGDWRNKIDEIDERIVQLMNQRAKCAIEIGRIKEASGIDIENLSREADVLGHVASINSGPLQTGTFETVFRTIIEACKRLEM